MHILRTSERRDFKRCQQRWWWAWREGLKPKGREADALWFGTGVHYALAEWYCGPGLTRGPHPAETWERWVGAEIRRIRSNRELDEARYVDARALGIAMLEGYVERYGRDDNWDVIHAEHVFQIDIPRRSGNGLLITLGGTFDLIFRDLETGEIWLGEHKTAASISTTHLQLDDQAGGYWMVASDICRERGLLRQGERIEGIMYNFLRKAMPDERPKDAEGRALNKNGTVSKRQPAQNFVREPVSRDGPERLGQLRRIQNEVAWMAVARKHPDMIMKTPTSDCIRCQFYDMCELHEKGGRGWREYKEAMYTPKDPYADHRKSAAE